MYTLQMNKSANFDVTTLTGIIQNSVNHLNIKGVLMRFTTVTRTLEGGFIVVGQINSVCLIDSVGQLTRTILGRLVIPLIILSPLTLALVILCVISP